MDGAWFVPGRDETAKLKKRGDCSDKVKSKDNACDEERK
jgi:hypothetical protein